jgi:hypothetical protein
MKKYRSETRASGIGRTVKQAIFMCRWSLIFPGSSEKWCQTYTSRLFHAKRKASEVFTYQLLVFIGGELAQVHVNFKILPTYYIHRHSEQGGSWQSE